jgi:hypothetical protein
VLRGYISDTSTGCNKCVECGGIHTIVTVFSLALSMISRFLVWATWPSKISNAVSSRVGVV